MLLWDRNWCWVTDFNVHKWALWSINHHQLFLRIVIISFQCRSNDREESALAIKCSIRVVRQKRGSHKSLLLLLASVATCAIHLQMICNHIALFREYELNGLGQIENYYIFQELLLCDIDPNEEEPHEIWDPNKTFIQWLVGWIQLQPLHKIQQIRVRTNILWVQLPSWNKNS